MECTLIKKCALCGQEMIISKNNMCMIAYKNKNYHTECFVTMCNERIKKNNRYSPTYVEALNNADRLKKETDEKLNNRIVQDELNIYLLSHYNIGAFSSNFWMLISDIQSGTYKGKRCNSIDLQALFDMWKAYQKELDSTSVWNEQHGKHIDGEERVKYDLAILMSNYGKYKKKIEKEVAASKEIQKTIEEAKERINYQAITKKGHDDNIDIASLIDDIF